MAKKRITYDWLALRQEYIGANRASGIGLREWCETQGINYNSARRHIKKIAIQNHINIKPNRLYSSYLEQKFGALDSEEEMLEYEICTVRKQLKTIGSKRDLLGEKFHEMMRQGFNMDAMKILDKILKMSEIEERLLGQIESLYSQKVNLKHQFLRSLMS